LIGQFVSLLGGNLAIVSVVYRVYQRTNSSRRVGVVSLTQFPFLIIGSLWRGAQGGRRSGASAL